MTTRDRESITPQGAGAFGEKAAGPPRIAGIPGWRNRPDGKVSVIGQSSGGQNRTDLLRHGMIDLY